MSAYFLKDVCIALHQIKDKTQKNLSKVGAELKELF